MHFKNSNTQLNEKKLDCFFKKNLKTFYTFKAKNKLKILADNNNKLEIIIINGYHQRQR